MHMYEYDELYYKIFQVHESELKLTSKTHTHSYVSASYLYVIRHNKSTLLERRRTFPIFNQHKHDITNTSIYHIHFNHSLVNYY
jgi:hypothetical protein